MITDAACKIGLQQQQQQQQKPNRDYLCCERTQRSQRDNQKPNSHLFIFSFITIVIHVILTSTTLHVLIEYKISVNLHVLVVVVVAVVGRSYYDAMFNYYLQFIYLRCVIWYVFGFNVQV